jgi:hypothetical protein
MLTVAWYANTISSVVDVGPVRDGWLAWGRPTLRTGTRRHEQEDLWTN